MKSVRYLLIGGGLACHNAAVALRAGDPDATILLVGHESQRPYNRPPLTKEFMQGKQTIDNGFLASQDFYSEHRIDLLLGTSVTRLDAAGKTAVLSDGQEVRYGKGLLGTGGRPLRLEIPGAELPGVHLFRTIDDALAVSALAGQGRRVVIAGGGFIGLELAASLTQRGCKVTVIEAGPHIWSRFADVNLAGFFQGYCQERGVQFRNGVGLAAVEGDGAASVAVTTAGERLRCDAVIMAVGIVPNVELAQAAGLAVDNGIVVNEYLQTSNPALYAAGDVCNYPDPFFLARRRVEHWGQAEYTGTLAGQNMAGARNRYELLTYVWSDIFDLHLEFAGMEQGADTILRRGRFADNQFSILYLKDHRLQAHFSVNVAKDVLSALGNLIEKRVSLAGSEHALEDPGVAPGEIPAAGIAK